MSNFCAPRSLLLGGLLSLGLISCGPAQLPSPDAINDPHEAQNRAVHQLNRTLDQSILSPASSGYGNGVPEPVREGISNIASNLSQPGFVLNNLLQLRIGDAAQNTLRFLINSTIGLGGLLDPATNMGLPEEITDFGETLHVWGVPEGSYVELPLVGPSTSRDTLGLVVDTAMNPLRHFVRPPESYYMTPFQIAAGLDSRYRFADLIDSTLNESADSYAQLRIFYLQNRRYELRGSAETLEYFDPYDDPYADPYSDPYYSDPYEDPYAN